MLRNRCGAITVLLTCLFIVACQAQGAQTVLPTISPSPSAAVPEQSLQPAAPESVLISSQHGVTVTLVNLQFSATQTVLDFIVQIDPVWGFTFDQYDAPPQQAYLHQATMVDETGQVIQPRSASWSGDRYIDPQTGIAYTGGTVVFDPTSGSRLDITLQIDLLTVRDVTPITFTITDPDQAQSIQMDRTLIFGELSPSVISAQWNVSRLFSITVAGSLVDDELMLSCIYLYQDPQWPPSGYTGCAYQDGVPEDLIGTILLNPPQSASQPVEVRVAADIAFLKPFQFTWIRSVK